MGFLLNLGMLLALAWIVASFMKTSQKMKEINPTLSMMWRILAVIGSVMGIEHMIMLMKIIFG